MFFFCCSILSKFYLNSSFYCNLAFFPSPLFLYHPVLALANKTSVVEKFTIHFISLFVLAVVGFAFVAVVEMQRLEDPLLATDEAKHDSHADKPAQIPKKSAKPAPRRLKEMAASDGPGRAWFSDRHLLSRTSGPGGSIETEAEPVRSKSLKHIGSRNRKKTKDGNWQLKCVWRVFCVCFLFCFVCLFVWLVGWLVD